VVKVEKFTGKENGVRYSLPATYLLVTPKSDGTASYEWVYLPDPDNEYAVRAISFMSKYTTDLTLDNNLLKKVTAKSDTAGVAAKTFDAAQSVYSARTTAASDAAKKEADKNAAAQKAIADAQLELKQAQAELTVLESNPTLNVTNAQLLAAKIKVAQAEIKLNAAKAAATQSLSAMNVPDGGNSLANQAWGPVLFKVVQTADDVKLVAVNIQQRFDTVSAVASPTTIPKRVFKIKGTSTFERPSSGGLKFEVEADASVDSVDSRSLDLIQGNVPYKGSTVTLTLQSDKKTVSVDISPCPPKGLYQMTLPYSTKSGEKPVVTGSITFEVR
jgi:multidrug efflux pump subunit AcrA (membrane-fusion protein)